MNRKFVAVLVVAIVAVALVASWWIIQRSGETTGIRYGGQNYPGEFLLYGHPEFWSEYDLDVEHTIFLSGGANNEALLAGDIDINCGSDSKTIALFNAMPDDALIIGTVQRGDRYATIVAKDSGISSWDDLLKTKGKTVGTKIGTGAEAVLRKFFSITESPELGRTYEWEDFEWSNLDVDDMISGLEAGLIDAFTVWEPTAAIAEAQGAGDLLRTYGDIALVPASIHTTKAFAYSHRDLLVKFLAAHLDKSDMIKTDPEGAAQLAAEGAAEYGLGVIPPEEAFEICFNRIDFTIEFDYTIIEAIYETADFLYDQGKIDKIPTLVFDQTFLEEAKQLQG